MCVVRCGSTFSVEDTCCIRSTFTKDKLTSVENSVENIFMEAVEEDVDVLRVRNSIKSKSLSLVCWWLVWKLHTTRSHTIAWENISFPGRRGRRGGELMEGNINKELLSQFYQINICFIFNILLFRVAGKF